MPASETARFTLTSVDLPSKQRTLGRAPEGAVKLQAGPQGALEDHTRPRTGKALVIMYRVDRSTGKQNEYKVPSTRIQNT